MDEPSKKLICCIGQVQGKTDAINRTLESIYTLALKANKTDADALTELNMTLAATVNSLQSLNADLETMAARTFVPD